MKKQAFLRGLLGFPIGMAMGYLITIFISLGFGSGEYFSCVPEFIGKMGSEINAVILQSVLCGLLGSSFAASSVIWEIDKWSIVKQTGIYFLITSVVMMVIAYTTYWMEHSINGFLIYFGIFVAIFIVTAVTQYAFWKNKLKKINSHINNQNQDI